MTTFAPFDPDAAREAAALAAWPIDGRSERETATGYAPMAPRPATGRDLTLRYSVDDARRDLGIGGEVAVL